MSPRATCQYNMVCHAVNFHDITCYSACLENVADAVALFMLHCLRVRRFHMLHITVRPKKKTKDFKNESRFSEGFDNILVLLKV